MMQRKLKSPLDREQAMLKGVVLNHKSQANTDFKPNLIYFLMQNKT